jgi:hypothetical protein
MSSPRQFLLCLDEIHAEVVDQFIATKLREEDGSKCSQWSGVWTDGERFGVVWAAPASDLFGTPEDDPSVQLATEIITDGVSDWEQYVPPAPEPEPEF